MPVSLGLHAGVVMGLAILVAGAAVAEPTPPARLAEFGDALKADDCRRAAPLASEISADRSLPADIRNVAAAAGVACRYRLRDPAAADAARRHVEAQPDDAEFPMLWLEIAIDSNVPDDALEALDLAYRRFPDVLRTADTDMMDRLRRQLDQPGRETQRQAMLLKLGEIGFGGNDLSEADYYRTEAIRILLKRGREADARRIAALVADYDSMEMMLVSRDFEPLWSLLEASAGPGMSRSNASALMAARANAEALGPAGKSPEATRARTTLMNALWDAGDKAAALAEGGKAYTTAQEVEAADEAGGWFINSHARLLRLSGDQGASDRRLAALSTLSIEERPWLISMRINRASTRVRQGANEELLGEIDALQADADRYGSPYAQQLVRRAKLCALAGAGRTAEAQAMRPAVIEWGSKAPGATMEALLCLNDRDAAAAQAIAGLEDPKFREDMIVALQPGISAPAKGVLKMRALLDDPAVAAAYARVGRDLPEALQ